ncbi:transposase, partial [Streptomyces olivaceus]
MREAVAATRTTLTTLAGLGTVLAAKVLGHIGRFPTEQHFAGYTGSAPPGRLQRQQRPPPARHRWQPRAELGAAHDRRLPDPRRRAR